MSPNHDGVVRLSGKLGNNAELSPRMGKLVQAGPVVKCARGIDHLEDVVMEPLSGIDAILALVVSGVKRGQAFEVLPHALGG